jgi:hypothetical protein
MVALEMGEGYATDEVVSRCLTTEVCYMAETLL